MTDTPRHTPDRYMKFSTKLALRLVQESEGQQRIVKNSAGVFYGNEEA